MAKNYWMSENRGQNWLDVWNMKHAKELLETKTKQVLEEDGKVFGGWRDDRTGKISDGYWTIENGKAVYTHEFYNKE